MTKVSIIILTKNAGDRFKLLLDKIYSQELQEEVEILIVDSGSTDKTPDVSKEFKARIYKIRAEEFHHSKTRNMGAELSTGDCLVYIAQDAIPMNGQWLSKLIKPLEGKEVAAVYGRQVAYEYAKPMEKFFYKYFYPDKRLILTREIIKNPHRFCLDNVFLSDVNVAIKREVWDEIRFNEDISFAEDKNFAIKALERGYKINYEPEAAVYHSHIYSISLLFKRRFNDGFAFYQLTGSSLNKAKGKGNGFLVRGMRYWAREFLFLVKNSYVKWIPYAVLYDLIFFIAFKLGELKGRNIGR